MLNILYLVHRAPYPPDKGDRVRSYHLLRFLGERGRVWLGTLSDGPVDPDIARRLESLTERLEIAPLGRSRWIRAGLSLIRGRTATEGLFANRRLSRTVRRWARTVRFDAVVLFCSSMAQYLCPRLRDVPLLFDCVDVDSEKWLQYAGAARFPGRTVYQAEGLRLRRLESRIGNQARAVSLVTEPEADLFRSFQSQANVVAIPNGVRSEYFSPLPHVQEDTSCIFVGAMDYKPNEDGVRWFTAEVWPQVLTRHPGAEFRIVGRDPSPRVQALERQPGVRVVGGVPDVRPYLARSAVSVAPLRVARGIQNKVLEALSMEKAVVASPAAMTGLAVQSGRELLGADTVAQWVDAVDELLTNPCRRRTLGINGRRYVETEHQWDRCLQPFAELLSPRAKAA